jgi:hypothetical protein
MRGSIGWELIHLSDKDGNIILSDQIFANEWNPTNLDATEEWLHDNGIWDFHSSQLRVWARDGEWFVFIIDPT